MAMQSEMHRSIMRLINSDEISSFLTTIVIDNTFEYSTLFKIEDIVDRYIKLNNLKGARNSKFKNVIPSVGMTQDALTKYSVSYKFSINGIFSTHPIFYSHGITNWYGLNSLDVNLEDIKNITQYKDEFAEAVKFTKNIITSKNPHLVDTLNFNVTELQKQLGLYVESTLSKEKLNLLPENEGTEEERKRARAINKQIQLNNSQ